MPKSNVFVIWNERELAEAVKKGIEATDPEYRVFIGGDTGTDTGLTVPGTIIEELKQCDQAIALIDGRYKNVTNPNVMFELGYAISIYGLERTAIYLIGASPDALPSDLKGLWLKSIIPVERIDDSLTDAQRLSIESLLESDERLKQELVSLHNAECRKRNYFNNAAGIVCRSFLDGDASFRTEKMKILVQYFRYRELVTNWSRSPSLMRHKCSEKDLAFFLLFLVQGAEFYDDFMDLRTAIRQINASRDALCGMLQDSVDFALSFLDFFINIRAHDQKDTGVRYQLDEHAYYRVLKVFRGLKAHYEHAQPADADNREYARWLMASVDEVLPYVHLVRANSVYDAAEREALFRRAAEAAECSIQRCSELGKRRDERDQNILNLFQAYNYRNMASAQIRLGDPAQAAAAIRRSLEFRRRLYDRYCNNPLVPDIVERNLKMEYYLSWYECRKHLADAGTEEERFHEPLDKKDIEHFLKKERYYDKRMRFYTERIRKLVEAE